MATTKATNKFMLAGNKHEKQDSDNDRARLCAILMQFRVFRPGKFMGIDRNSVNVLTAARSISYGGIIHGEKDNC